MVMRRELTGARPAEPAALLNGVRELVDGVLAAELIGRWPQAELNALVTYLNAEVLPRARQEEREVFTGRLDSGRIAQLRRDHRRLVEATEVLARAARGEGNQSVAHITATARSLVSQLDRHLASERAVLAFA
jgi:hypothetical protein